MDAGGDWRCAGETTLLKARTRGSRRSGIDVVAIRKSVAALANGSW